MRFPKRGFINVGRVEYAVVNVGDLDAHFAAGDEVSLDILIRRGLVKSPHRRLKVLGEGELSKCLIVKADRFSRTARAKIEAAGGRIETGPAAADSRSGEEA